VASWEEREDRESEIKARWDRDAVLAQCGSVGPRMLAVIQAIWDLDRGRAEALDSAYWTTRSDAETAGVVAAWERAFTYSAGFPEHPGDLYAIDPWSRVAFSYAGLIAREKTWALGQGEIGIVPVERTAMGAVLALSVDLAGEGGWYHPVDAELASWLARPWREVMKAL
jgi:hypothetical protein